MPLFDAYVAVDWSAHKRPKTGANSIWICSAGGPPENPSTREEATERVRALLREHVSAGRRVLVGFDFAYGYPQGFAAALGAGKEPWRRVWEHLGREIADDPTNRSNRFDVAVALNERLDAPAFWGWPTRDDRLPSRKPQQRVLPEFRATERFLGAGGHRPFSVWQLAGHGSVGSQALVGIPRVLSLRDDAELAPVSAVWPFETGFAVPTAQVVHAEIWPSLVATRGLHPVQDADQVASVVARWAALDAADALAPLFEAPGGLSEDDAEAAVREEGWILGPERAAAK
jgi:precorrin-8X/cobalt-precorrin-8 methylmutase